MFEKFQKFRKPCCIEFYNAYDSILKNMGAHIQFFSFLKSNFNKIQSTEHAHKALVELFIKFIRSEKFDIQLDLPEEAKKKRTIYNKIFEFCYQSFFKETAVPSDPNKLNHSLFKSETKCLKLFDNVQRCLFSKEFTEYNKEKLQYLINEFTFIHTFSNFLFNYKKIEKVDFFKRFFFIYPFDKDGISCDCNSEWLDYHEQKFKTIKNYINSSEDELQNVREWCKKQLNTVEFAALSEGHKSIFFTEMFIAFGNVSSKKTGDAKGFRIPLNNLFYLGRYYNIQYLPLLYVKKERDTLETIAHETWRRICDLKLTSKEEIEEARRKNISGKMSEPNEKELYGKNAPQVYIERLMKQFPNLEQIELNDNYDIVSNKLVSSLDVSKFPSIKSIDDIPAMLSDIVSKIGIKDTVDKGVKESIANNILNQKNRFLETIVDASAPLSASLSINKSGIGIITHYDLRKQPTLFQDAQTILEKIVQNSL